MPNWYKKSQASEPEIYYAGSIELVHPTHLPDDDKYSTAFSPDSSYWSTNVFRVEATSLAEAEELAKKRNKNVFYISKNYKDCYLTVKYEEYKRKLKPNEEAKSLTDFIAEKSPDVQDEEVQKKTLFHIAILDDGKTDFLTVTSYPYKLHQNLKGMRLRGLALVDTDKDRLNKRLDILIKAMPAGKLLTSYIIGYNRASWALSSAQYNVEIGKMPRSWLKPYVDRFEPIKALFDKKLQSFKDQIRGLGTVYGKDFFVEYDEETFYTHFRPKYTEYGYPGHV